MASASLILAVVLAVGVSIHHAQAESPPLRGAPPPALRPPPARPPPSKKTSPFGSFLVLGDSISSGAAGASLGIRPQPAWAWDKDGKFVEANGTGNYVDHVQAAAKLSGARVHNYAVGGAGFCASSFGTVTFDQGVEYTLSQASTFDGQEKTVALVMLGANDWTYFFIEGNITVDTFLNKSAEITDCLKAGLYKLAALPSLKDSIIYVALLEALELVPLTASIVPPEVLPDVPGMVDYSNAAIRAAVDEVAQVYAYYKVPIQLKIIDTTTAYRQGFASLPAAIDSLEPCLGTDAFGNTTQCATPHTHAFVDNVHYSSVLHKDVIAPAIIAALVSDKLIKP